MIENPMVSGLAADQHRLEAEAQELLGEFTGETRAYASAFLRGNTQLDVGRLSFTGARRLRQTLAESVSSNLCDLPQNPLHDIIAIVAQCARGEFEPAQAQALRALALGVVMQLAQEHAEAMQQ